MRAIFISYRRDDAEGQSGRLFDDLSRHFGADTVFMDVATIEPGRDFRRVIDQQVASCGVLLAIIGKNWVTAKDADGARRLDDPMDFVRLETASALKRDIPVIPVLVHGAAMPRAQDLPDDLKELAFRNGVELHHARWESDVQVLVKALQAHVKTSSRDVGPPVPAPAAAPALPASAPRQALPAWVAPVGILVLALAGFAWWQTNPGVSPKSDVSVKPVLDSALPPEKRTEGPRINLVGNWSAPGCTLVFTKDDGNTVQGFCNTPMVHKVDGQYTNKNRIDIVISRVDSKGCVTTAKGVIKLMGDDVIETSQDGWDGCDVKTDGATSLNKRM